MLTRWEDRLDPAVAEMPSGALDRTLEDTHVEVAVGWTARPLGPGGVPHPRSARLRGSGTARQPHRDAAGAGGAHETTVPVPDHRELRAGTLASIVRQSGLRRAGFE